MVDELVLDVRMEAYKPSLNISAAEPPKAVTSKAKKGGSKLDGVACPKCTNGSI